MKRLVAGIFTLLFLVTGAMASERAMLIDTSGNELGTVSNPLIVSGSGLWEGADPAIYYTGGNVGIGTSVPLAALEVVSDLDVTDNVGYGAITIKNSAGTNGLNLDANEVQAAGSILYIQNENSYGTNINNKVFVTTTNVGIGTAIPLSPFQISSDTTPTVSQFRVTGNGTGEVSIVAYAADNASLNFDSSFYDSSWLARDTTAFQLYKLGGKLLLLGNSGLTVGNTFNPTTRVTFQTDGNVGIGSTDPQSALDVAGNLNVSGDIYSNTLSVSGTGDSYFTGGNLGIGTTIPRGELDVRRSDGVDGYLYGNGSQLTGISTSQWTGTNPIYTTTANVGIGTAAPRGIEQLAVDGRVYIQNNIAPSYALELRGPISTTSGGARIAFRPNATTTSTSGDTLGRVDFYGNGSSSKDILAALILGTATANPGTTYMNGGMAFYAASSGGILEKVRLNAVGIGIGTTAPSSALSVGSQAGTALGHVDGTNDLYVKDGVEVDGTLYADGNIYGNDGATSNGLGVCWYAGRLGHCTGLMSADGSCVCAP